MEYRIKINPLHSKWTALVSGVALLGCAVNPTVAGELNGYLAVESRTFLHSAIYTDQSDHSGSLAGNLEYYHDWDGGDQRLAFTGFARLDTADSERSHADIRELYWRRNFDNAQLYLGVRKLFWGVTETVHLVDVINQDDLVENPDGEDKLGQPMISLLLARDWGTLQVFGLPGFRERTFPGAEGRLRGPLVVDREAVRYQSAAEEKHVDVAIRWSHVLGDWDLGVSHFKGTARDPVFEPLIQNGEPVALRPYYRQIDQTGLDVQATKEDWLWKLEAISIKEQGGDRNTAVVGGFEYTFVGVAATAADLGLLLEYQFDDRTGAAATAAQNDLALGARWTLNDVQGTEVLAAVSVDLDNRSRFVSVEASRRLSDYWSLEAEMRLFSHMAEDDPGYMLREEDYIQVEVRRYF